jgi:hypothetical protein
VCANDDWGNSAQKVEKDKRENRARRGKYLMKINLHIMKMEMKAFLVVICDAVCDATLCWSRRALPVNYNVIRKDREPLYSFEGILWESLEKVLNGRVGTLNVRWSSESLLDNFYDKIVRIAEMGIILKF